MSFFKRKRFGRVARRPGKSIFEMLELYNLRRGMWAWGPGGRFRLKK